MRKLTALGSDATLSHADDEITKSSSRRIKRIQRERGVKRQSKIERNHHTGEREREREICTHVYGDAKHRKFFDERKLRIDRPDSGSSDRIQIGLPLVSRAKNLNVLLAALKSC